MTQTKPSLARARFGTAFKLAILICAITNLNSQAAISVGSGGVGPISFATIADTNGWTTANRLPNSGTAVTTGTDMDNAVQTNTAPSIAVTAGTSPVNAAVTQDTANPPATSGTARWDSALGSLATRPTGNAYTLLMGEFQNNSGGCINAISISFDMNTFSFLAAELPGWRVYYSLTGAGGSWQLIPNLSDVVVTGNLSTNNMPLSANWNNGASLYLLFADDNGNGVSDPSYTIDNLTLGVASCNLTAIIITNSPASLSVPERGAAVFTVGAGGSPLNYFWFSNNVQVSGNNSPTFTIPSAAYPANNGAQIYVVVSNSLSFVTSATATLTVVPDTTPPTIVRVVGNPGLDTVTITFSEDILPSGVDPANFTLYPTGSDPDADYLLTTGAVLNNGSNVVLTTDLRIAGTNYSLRVAEIRDNSSQQNPIDPNPTDIPFITQEVFLVDFSDNNVWSYDINNGDRFGTGWETVGYDDSLWPSGPAPLGLDSSAGTGTGPGLPQLLINTPLPYSAATGAPTYFRRHITLPTLTNGLVVTLRDVVEDGAVYYVNGVETFRHNVPAGALNFATLASGQVDPTPIQGPFDFPITNFHSGDNVIAVVVLQSARTSSDLEMAIELTAVIPQYPTGPIVINAQPAASTTVNEGSPFTLGVGVSGAIPITYQWRKGGVPIGGQTNPTYSVVSAVPSNAGTYTVAVSNSFGGLISSSASVTVVPDNAAPVILSAIGTTNMNEVVVTLHDEGRGIDLATANNPANYNVHLRAGGPNLGIASVVAVNSGTNTVVTITTTAPRAAGENYTVTLTGVKDQSAAANPVTPGSHDISATVIVFGFAQVWRYEETGVDLGTAWRASGYNDSAWPSGAGFLAFEDSVGPLTTFTNLAGGNGTNTVLSLTNNVGGGIGGTNVTIYFRTTASLPFDPNLAGNTVYARSYIDDGAAIYVNGAESMRFNLTNTANYTNFAIAGSTENVLTVSNLTGFVQGNNVIAVEVHQNAIASSDIDWGMQLEALVTTFAASCPSLHISINAGTRQTTLSWSGAATLQETTALQTPSGNTVWNPSARVNGVPFTPSGNRYYRLTCP